MTKITSQQLVDHAAGLLDDKNNFKAYFDDFNKNYVTSNFENFEKFKNNWKAIIYVVIKGVYARFATEGHVELNEYLLALEGLLKNTVMRMARSVISDQYANAFNLDDS